MRRLDRQEVLVQRRRMVGIVVVILQTIEGEIGFITTVRSETVVRNAG